jgi:hypothetical protein
VQGGRGGGGGASLKVCCFTSCHYCSPIVFLAYPLFNVHVHTHDHTAFKKIQFYLQTFLLTSLTYATEIGP